MIVENENNTNNVDKKSNNFYNINLFFLDDAGDSYAEVLYGKNGFIFVFQTQDNVKRFIPILNELNRLTKKVKKLKRTINTYKFSANN